MARNDAPACKCGARTYEAHLKATAPGHTFRIRLWGKRHGS